VRLTLRQARSQGLVAVATLSSIAILSGCGSGPSVSAAPAGPSCATPGPDNLQIACPAVADRTLPQPLDAVRLEPDGRTLLLSYTGGPDPAPTVAHPWSCGFLAGIRVAESDSAVRLTVMLGDRYQRFSSGVESGCALGGYARATTVRLSTPLGSRPVYDGGYGGAPVVVRR
jgi:hypothetical protein